MTDMSLNKSREFSWLLLLTPIYKYAKVVENTRKNHVT